MKYDILEASSSGELIKKVSGYLTNGWKLAGGVTKVVVDNDIRSNSGGLYLFRPAKFSYSQAIYLEENQDKKQRKII